jgi:hypothetical protein
MNSVRHLIALVAGIGALAFGGATTTRADDIAPAVTSTAVVHTVDVSVDLSAQGRRGGGHGGNVGGGRVGGQMGRVGGQMGRVGQQGRVGRIDGRIGRQQGRVGRIDGRIGRIDGRIGYVGRVGYRYGRYGYRYGRYGGVGFVPVPIPLPSGPGGVVVPQGIAAPCPVCPVQACLVSVFSEPNLTGQALETRDNQPRLDLNGWQNQISSIMVKSGTWDFYPDLEFKGGPALRLAPGSYVLLEPQWTKRIGSFMCVR